MGTHEVTAIAQRRFYYGWVVGTLATTETISLGILYYPVSAFLVPMQREAGSIGMVPAS